MSESASGSKKAPVPYSDRKRWRILVMGELLRRGYDARLADRDTKGYDVFVGRPQDESLEKVQVKSVRSQPWFVRPTSFTGELRNQVTIYVRLGKADGRKPVRFFTARNRDLAEHVAKPGWKDHAFMRLRDLEPYEGRWANLDAD